MDNQKVLDALSCKDTEELQQILHTVHLNEMEDDNCITSSIAEELEKTFELETEENISNSKQIEIESSSENSDEEDNDNSDNLWGSNESIVSILKYYSKPKNNNLLIYLIYFFFCYKYLLFYYLAYSMLGRVTSKNT